MASTPAGGVVMFGGERVTQPGTSLSDTHRLSSGNQSWSRSANAPVARSGHSMAGIMVNGLPKYFVFGGITSGGQPSADTWQTDGSTWDPRGQGGAVPTARSAHGMVAGQLGGPFAGNPRIWMFGGFNAGELSDLWSYQPDFDQWNFLGSAAGQPVGAWPIARSEHSLTFQQGASAGDERVFLFGGRTGSAGFTNDLWRFNPNTSTWQLLSPSNPPPARRAAAMAYLPGQGGIVMFGGFAASSSALADTWIYDPTANAWTQRTPLIAPPGRSGHAVTVDVTGSKLIMMGGVDATGQPASGTWIWDSQAPGSPPGAWIEQLPVPSARTGAAMAFDSNVARRKHVLFGGTSSASSNVLDETWELDGIDWTRKTPSSRPSARTDAGLVYHAGRNRIVLYGGRNQAGASFANTWEWNGTTWTPPAVGAPPAAGGIQPVYDTARNRIVMPVENGASMQTWAMAGSAGWSLLLPVVSPPARTNYGAAYDTRRDQVVMFGGMSSNVRGSATYNNETWIFDGTSWVRRFPATSPSPRGWCQLSYDESRSRVVLFGGADATNAFEETWEWDGSNWIQESPAASPTNPTASYGHASSYDGKRALTVTHGVLGTWDYGPVAPADVTSYGVGCTTSSNATLNLKQLGWSRLWLGERLELDIEGAPNFSLGLMLWGLSDASFGAGIPLPLDLRLIGFSTGPCYLSTSADITSEAVFPPTTRYTSFPMPVDPFLLGLELYLQIAYFDAPANPTNPPVVTSNALKMKLGQKATLISSPFEPNPALNMVRIGAGTFPMGSPVTPLNVTPYFNQGYSQPVHSVTISQPFWMGKYEVTQAQYQAVIGSNPSFHQGPGYPQASQLPVEQLPWADAVAYCAALTLSEAASGRVPVGYQYRLPTEAEWEYCCRAGTLTEFHTGASLTTSQANVLNILSQPAVGGSYAANPWGLSDMHGNVAEWCLDAWDGSAANYPSSPPSSPVSDPYVSSGQDRVIRGGGFASSLHRSRSTERLSILLGGANLDVGFRLVLAPIIVP